MSFPGFIVPRNVAVIPQVCCFRGSQGSVFPGVDVSWDGCSQILGETSNWENIEPWEHQTLGTLNLENTDTAPTVTVFILFAD